MTQPVEDESDSGPPRSGRNMSYAELARDVTGAPEAVPLFCVVIDLGDLQRSNRVPRLLGPEYSDSLVDAAEVRIRDVVASQVRLHRVDSGCFAFVRLVPPGDFISLSEQSGMARFITTWVVNRALGDLADWTAAGFGFGVSINVSAINLAEENFAQRIADAIRRSGVDPALVELEFTEGAFVRDSPRVRGAVADLAAIGVGISIDDFGTGYSNLQYLRDIPANVLKIDQSFIRSLGVNARDGVIVRSMIELAHALGYRGVAEGIEDVEAMTLLADWNCDEGQGYFIARPAPVAAMKAWVAARSGED